MPVDKEPTRYDTPIPLRDNESRPPRPHPGVEPWQGLHHRPGVRPGPESRPAIGTPEHANPWTRLEAVDALRQRLDLLRQQAAVAAEAGLSARTHVAASELSALLLDVATELQDACWGRLDQVEAVRERSVPDWLERRVQELWGL